MTCCFKVVIPARYGSSRLPGKPLLEIMGKPMILHVCDRARESGAQQVVVATDDIRIQDVVRNYGFDAVMTSIQHQSGTERLAEVANILQWDDDTIVVNLQGDEPLIPAKYISLVAETLALQSISEVATLATGITEREDVFNPNSVKVILNKQGYALYFSRAAIPWDRERFHQACCSTIIEKAYLRHIGIYAYRVCFLQRYIGWTPSGLEAIEMLEQLRILWEGEPISVATVKDAPEAGVDTAADVLRVESKLIQLAE